MTGSDVTTSPTAASSATATTFTPLRVTSVVNDPHDCVIVTFDTSGHGDRFRFEHGQHVNLRHDFDGIDVRRSYSICSAAPDGELRIAIRQVPGGVFSTWATNELHPGDLVEVTEPTGHFTHPLDPTTARNYTFFAAGSGITPVYSMMSTILAREPQARVSLVYLNRTALTAMLIDDVQDLRDRHLGRVQVAFAFTREQSGSTLLSGRPDRQRLDDLITAGFLAADADEAFLCGPIELTDLARDALIDAGMPAGSIHREIFTTKQQGTVTLAPQEVTETSVVVATGHAVLNGRTVSFDLYEGDTILDAVQRVRPDAPFSCRSGVCSTCQAVVRGGEVEMAVNYGLSADEVARGYVLTCQSRPTTAEVDVDYDA
jgi:ring-1,2-phenylacetyl-CoA epoxidase subunit PaaE